MRGAGAGQSHTWGRRDRDPWGYGCPGEQRLRRGGCQGQANASMGGAQSEQDKPGSPRSNRGAVLTHARSRSGSGAAGGARDAGNARAAGGARDGCWVHAPPSAICRHWGHVAAGTV